MNNKLNNLIMHSLFIREYNEEVDSQPYVCSDILKEYNCDTVEDLLNLFNYPTNQLKFPVHGFLPDYVNENEMKIQPGRMGFMVTKTKINNLFKNISLYMYPRYIYDNIWIKRNTIPSEQSLNEIIIPIINMNKKTLRIIDDELNNQAKAREYINEIVIPSYRFQTNLTIASI